MSGEKRRVQILKAITNSKTALSANALANTYKVSRQIIVGDIALLRAGGHKIMATPKGYLIENNDGRYYAKVAVNHNAKDTETELRALLKMGVYVIDVSVDHPIYGEISGNLDFKTHEDIDTFMHNITSEKAELLSVLTQGTHIHTLSCINRAHFIKAQEELDRLGFLIKNI
jgi:uncharacterized protein